MALLLGYFRCVKHSEDHVHMMSAAGYRALLLDIEGTTTSISFVKDTLFPYVRQELGRYLGQNWGTAELISVLEDLKHQNVEDVRTGLTDRKILTEDDGRSSMADAQASIVGNVLWQMDHDRKTGALKRLQGLIYREAYAKGHLNGHVYDDVPVAFKSWTESGRRIYIYSSGSVEAQKLLFGHSTAGDLRPYISGYFDTTVGPKISSDSYTKISTATQLPAKEILFLTDIAQEARAAHEAGLQVRLMIRPGNGVLTAQDRDDFGTTTSFHEL